MTNDDVFLVVNSLKGLKSEDYARCGNLFLLAVLPNDADEVDGDDFVSVTKQVFGNSIFHLLKRVRERITRELSDYANSISIVFVENVAT